MVSALAKKKRKKVKSIYATIVVIIIVVIVCAVFALRFYLSNQIVKTNEDTLCPEDGAVAYTAILIDSTDSFNHVQKAFLDKYLTKIKKELKTFEQISLFVVGDESLQKIAPKFLLCNPGNNANELYQNPQRIQKKWREDFQIPLSSALNGLISSEKASRSPIMEMIQAVSINGFPFEDVGKDKKIIIISDMLHHTDKYSLYQENINFEIFRETPYYRHLKCNLADVEVQILLLIRKDYEHLQKRNLINFWEQYIQSQDGGIITLVQPVYG